MHYRCIKLVRVLRALLNDPHRCAAAPSWSRSVTSTEITPLGLGPDGHQEDLLRQACVRCAGSVLRRPTTRRRQRWPLTSSRLPGEVEAALFNRQAVFRNTTLNGRRNVSVRRTPRSPPNAHAQRRSELQAQIERASAALASGGTRQANTDARALARYLSTICLESHARSLERNPDASGSGDDRGERRLSIGPGPGALRTPAETSDVPAHSVMRITHDRPSVATSLLLTVDAQP